MSRLAMLARLLLAACATAKPFDEAVNGPVLVAIGDVGHICAIAGQGPRAGCVVRHPNGRLEVYCEDATRLRLAQCFAHEIRHIVEPEWRHEGDGQ